MKCLRSAVIRHGNKLLSSVLFFRGGAEEEMSWRQKVKRRESITRNAFWTFLISVRWEGAQLLISCGVFITFWAAFVCLLQSTPHAVLLHSEPRCSLRWRKTQPASLYIDSSTPVTSGGEGTGEPSVVGRPYKVIGYEGHSVRCRHRLWVEASLRCSHWWCFVLFCYCKGLCLPSSAVTHREWRGGPREVWVASADGKGGRQLKTKQVSLSEAVQKVAKPTS